MNITTLQSIWQEGYSYTALTHLKKSFVLHNEGSSSTLGKVVCGHVT